MEKITFVVTVPAAPQALADLAGIKDRFAQGAIDAIKAQEYAISACGAALNGAGAHVELVRIGVTVEIAAEPADITFPDAV